MDKKALSGASIGSNPLFNNRQVCSDLLDMREAWKRGEFTRSTAGPASNGRVLKVKNTTGSNRLRGELLYIGDSTLAETDSHQFWHEGEMVDTTNRWAVLLEPAEAGKYARAAVHGVVKARVTITDTSHKFARINPGDYLYQGGSIPYADNTEPYRLQSSPFGSIPLLSNPSGATGVQDCSVLLGVDNGTQRTETVVNITGFNRSAFDCLDLYPYIEPSVDLEGFKYRPVCSGQLPVGGFGTGANVADSPLCILMEPAKPEETARAVISGLTACQLNITDENRYYPYARTTPGDTFLTPAESDGPARVIWRPATGTGLQWGWVFITQQTTQDPLYYYQLDEFMGETTPGEASATVFRIGGGSFAATVYDPAGLHNQSMSSAEYAVFKRGYCIKREGKFYAVSSLNLLKAMLDVTFSVNLTQKQVLTVDASGTAWSSQSYEEAGIAEADHTHDFSDITTGTIPSHEHVVADITDAGALAELNQVGTAQIASGAVTAAKLGQISQGEFYARSSAGAGPAEVVDVSGVRSLLNVENGATADQTDAEIETAYNNQVAVMSQAEAEAGTSTDVRRITAERIKQAIDALGGGNGDIDGGSPDSVYLAAQSFDGGGP